MAPHALIGKKAPTFTIPKHDGELYTFNPGSNGRPTALFFYPKSGSYGCTKEACQFRDALSEKDVYKSTQIEVVGVSPDSVEMQKKFVEKQGLTYSILSDTKGDARKAYGVEGGLFGLTESGRVTFVIDSEGVVRDSLSATMNFGSHIKFVSKWLDGLQTGASSKVTDAKPTSPTVPETAPASNPIDSTPAPAIGLEPAAAGPGVAPAAMRTE